MKKVIKSKQDRELVGLHENGSPNAAANGNGTVTANGSATGNGTLTPKGSRIPNIRRSKLLIVDLAGSERVDKSGMLECSFVSHDRDSCLTSWD